MSISFGGFAASREQLELMLQSLALV